MIAGKVGTDDASSEVGVEQPILQLRRNYELDTVNCWQPAGYSNLSEVKVIPALLKLLCQLPP